MNTYTKTITSMKTILILVLLLIALSTTIVLATSGDLDTSFSTDGMDTTSFITGTDNCTDVEVKADGKIVVAGHADYDFVVAQYTSAGILDTSFSSDGKQEVNMGTFGEAHALEIDANGKILVAGHANDDVAIMRLNTDGSLDTNFDSDGKVLLDINVLSHDRLYDMVIQDDGKIVLVGFTWTESTYPVILVMRLNSDGSLDTTFSSDGMYVLGLGVYGDYGEGVAIQPDGKILVVGRYDTAEDGSVLLVLRLNSNGTLDSSYGGGDGVVVEIISGEKDYGRDIESLPDGTSIVGGELKTSSDETFFALKLDSDGAIDEDFGTLGLVTDGSDSVDSAAYDIDVNEFGKIFLSGEIAPVSDRDFMIVKLNPDGSLDTSFSGDGMVNINFHPDEGYHDEAHGLASQADGKIIAAGVTNSGTDLDFAVARIENFDSPGTDTPGLYDPDTYKWMLRNSNSFGAWDLAFRFGKPGETNWLPIAGDWDDDGVDSIGLYDPDTNIWRLRDTNSTGSLDYVFRYGKWGVSTWLPVTGDWNGDGTDTIGLYDQAKNIWRLRDSNSIGSWDYLFRYGKYGQSNWLPVVGDWDGDGTDTIGLYDPDTAIWRLSDSSKSPSYDYIFRFGVVGETNWLPVAGDWNGDGYDSIGLYDPDTYKWRLRDSNCLGTWDYIFRYGRAGETNWLPIVGDWDGN